MSVYLHDIPLPQAQSYLQQALQEAGLEGTLGIEEIHLTENALGRVLAEPVWAIISSPHYHASAMDGFAVRSQDTIGATPGSPIELQCSSVDETGAQSAYIDTGDPVPSWSDAVVPIENVEPIDETGLAALNPRRPSAIRIRAAVAPWSHVRPMGEDLVATQLILPGGHRLRPVDLGALAAGGHSRVRVARCPRVAILPTGSELVDIGSKVKAGEIIEYNSIVLAAQVNQWGGLAFRYPITLDNFQSLQAVVKQAAIDSDLVLINAGSSAGSEDFSAQVISSLGVVLVHGVAVRPGHPVILGMLKTNGKQTPVIGVPGYPVSAALTGEIFIEPLLSRWLGCASSQPVTLQATLTRKITSPAGDDDFVRVAVGKIDDRVLAAPLSRGAGVITSLVHADGLALLPRGIQGLAAGDQVEVRLYRSAREIAQTIFAIGSHDITLDLLAQYLAQYHRRLVSANVGSMGGLVALQRGETHLAGCHLLDPQTGDYNITYIPKYLPNTPVKLITLVEREQGLMVHHGNPLRIVDLRDLARSDISFINRQRGAGTRVLLDYHLDRLGIASSSIRGYNQEEFTHLAVAAAIASGRANCGLGIAAAARALELEFIPLFRERYDLVIPTQYYSSALLEPVLDILSQTQFRKAVAGMPGYHTSHMGTIVAEIG